MTDDTTPQQHEWRWPPHIAMSPSSLKAFGQCPSRVKMRYLQNLDPPDKWIRHFALGNATHSALATIAQQLKANVPLIGEEHIRTICRGQMPEAEYPSEEAREFDIRLVLDWVRRGSTWLQALDVDEWLIIERSERRALKLLPTASEYTLMTRPDLIIRRHDEEGTPFFHVIDWKTGAVYEEPDVPVIVRFVLKDQLAEWVGDASSANVTFTWFWLEANERRDVETSVEHCNYHWPGIVEQMEAVVTETEWKATPGWYCRYCPYYGNYCPEEIPPEDNL